MAKERYFRYEPDELGDSYSEQTGHYYRGLHDELRNFFGLPPKCLGSSIQIQKDIKRKMRRVPDDGKK